MVLLSAIFACGVVAGRNRVFTCAYFAEIEAGFQWFGERQPGGEAWYYEATSKIQRIFNQRESAGNNALP